jgi:hypothetical protein
MLVGDDVEEDRIAAHNELQIPLASTAILIYPPLARALARAQRLWRPRWTTSRPGRRRMNPTRKGTSDVDYARA